MTALLLPIRDDDYIRESKACGKALATKVTYRPVSMRGSIFNPCFDDGGGYVDLVWKQRKYINATLLWDSGRSVPADRLEGSINVSYGFYRCIHGYCGWVNCTGKIDCFGNWLEVLEVRCDMPIGYFNTNARFSPKRLKIWLLIKINRIVLNSLRDELELFWKD